MIPLFASKGAFGALRRLTVKPSEKRAAGPSQQLVTSANNGNVTAAAAILYRTGIGIAKERAVWQAALQRVSSDMVMLGQRYARQLLPLVDHSGPESAARTALANVRDAASFASQTRAATPRPKESKQVAPGTTKRATPGTRGGGRRAARGGAPRAGRAARAPRQQLVWRYDPDSGQRRHVPNDSIEAAEWPSRKPRKSRRATQAARRLEGVAARGVVSGGLKLAGAVRAAGAAAGLGITATGAAIVGAFGVGLAIGAGINKLAAYLSTTERNERKALAFRAARLQFAKDNGRPMTATEVRELGAGFKASLTR